MEAGNFEEAEREKQINVMDVRKVEATGFTFHRSGSSCCCGALQKALCVCFYSEETGRQVWNVGLGELPTPGARLI